MEIESIAKQIVDSAIKVHKTLGPGLLEAVYQKCLAYELRSHGLNVECEVAQPIQYGEIHIDTGYRIDMIIDNCIVIENKTVEQILPIHQAQILTYLKMRGNTLGFLLNWNVTLMKNGIKRIVNNHKNI